MKQNESNVDRIIRVVAGIALIFIGFSGGGFAIVAGVIGAVLVFTGVLGFCPIYAALKIGTLKK